MPLGDPASGKDAVAYFKQPTVIVERNQRAPPRHFDTRAASFAGAMTDGNAIRKSGSNNLKQAADFAAR
jgi:hypothetical protein